MINNKISIMYMYTINIALKTSHIYRILYIPSHLLHLLNEVKDPSILYLVCGTILKLNYSGVDGAVIWKIIARLIFEKLYSLG